MRKKRGSTRKHFRKVVVKKRVKQCKWCGGMFIPSSPNHCYCSDRCKLFAQQECTRERVERYRKRYSDVVGSDWLGTGHLGSHAVQDFDEEEYLVKKELYRIRRQKK